MSKMLTIVVGGKLTDDFFFLPHDFFWKGAFWKVSVVNRQLFYYVKILFELLSSTWEEFRLSILRENGLAYLWNGFR